MEKGNRICTKLYIGVAVCFIQCGHAAHLYGVWGEDEIISVTEAVKSIKTRSDGEPSCLFVILHQQWRAHTTPSFTGESPGNEHIVNINL